MCLKWECTGTPTIFKCDYPINYVAVDVNGRRNRQRNTVIIIELKKVTEHTAAEAEVNVGQIDIFGAFIQGSSNPSPPPRRRKRPHEHCGHEVEDDDNDDDGNNNSNYGGGGGGRGGEGRGRKGKSFV
jgi:hypothetical protein